MSHLVQTNPWISLDSAQALRVRGRGVKGRNIGLSPTDINGDVGADLDVKEGGILLAGRRGKVRA